MLAVEKCFARQLLFPVFIGGIAMSKRFFVFLGILACVLFGIPQTGRSEEGVEILLNAVNRQLKEAPILTGRGSYELTITPGEKSEDEIEAEIEKERERVRPRYSSIPGVNLEKFFNEEIPRYVRERYTVKKMTGTFQFDYSEDDNRYTKRILIFEADPSIPRTLIEKHSVSEGEKNKCGNPNLLMYDKVFGRGCARPVKSENAFLSSNDSVIVSNSFMTMENFHLFGRLDERALDTNVLYLGEDGFFHARELPNFHRGEDGFLHATEQPNLSEDASGDSGGAAKNFEIVETKPFEGGAESFILEDNSDLRAIQRCTIVPALGYICPSLQIYDRETGRLVREYAASDYVLLEPSGLYYPMVYTESTFDPTTGNLAEKREYKFNRESISLNEPMNPEDFTLDVSEGWSVQENHDGILSVYKANSDGALTLAPGGLDLEKQSWLTKDADIPIPPKEAPAE